MDILKEYPVIKEMNRYRLDISRPIFLHYNDDKSSITRYSRFDNVQLKDGLISVHRAGTVADYSHLTNEDKKNLVVFVKEQHEGLKNGNPIAYIDDFGEYTIGLYNSSFNDELERYIAGNMKKSEMLRLGHPVGVMKGFLPDLPIVVRQSVLHKGSEKKHDINLEALHDMPERISLPIFVFKRDNQSLGILTEMKDRQGLNVCVAIALAKEIQDGKEILVVNDLRSIHGRNVEDILFPIIQNNSLRWVDKEKGLAWFSSASQYVRQEITKQDLDFAAKVVKDFDNRKYFGKKLVEEVEKSEIREENKVVLHEIEGIDTHPMEKIVVTMLNLPEQRITVDLYGYDGSVHGLDVTGGVIQGGVLTFADGSTTDLDYMIGTTLESQLGKTLADQIESMDMSDTVEHPIVDKGAAIWDYYADGLGFSLIDELSERVSVIIPNSGDRMKLPTPLDITILGNNLHLVADELVRLSTNNAGFSTLAVHTTDGQEYDLDMITLSDVVALHKSVDNYGKYYAFGQEVPQETIDELRADGVTDFSTENLEKLLHFDAQDNGVPTIDVDFREGASERVWQKLNEILPENGDKSYPVGRAQEIKEIVRAASPEYDTDVFVCGDELGGINTFRMVYGDLARVENILDGEKYTVELLEKSARNNEYREERGYLMDVISEALHDMNGHVEIPHTELPSIPLKGEWAGEGDGHAYMEIITGEHNISDAVFHDVHAETYPIDEVVGKLGSSEIYELTVAVRKAQIANLVGAGDEISFVDGLAVSRDDSDTEKDYVNIVKFDKNGKLEIVGYCLDEDGNRFDLKERGGLDLSGFDDLFAELKELREAERLEEEEEMEPQVVQEEKKSGIAYSIKLNEDGIAPEHYRIEFNKDFFPHLSAKEISSAAGKAGAIASDNAEQMFLFKDYATAEKFGESMIALNEKRAAEEQQPLENRRYTEEEANQVKSSMGEYLQNIVNERFSNGDIYSTEIADAMKEYMVFGSLTAQDAAYDLTTRFLNKSDLNHPGILAKYGVTDVEAEAEKIALRAVRDAESKLPKEQKQDALSEQRQKMKQILDETRAMLGDNFTITYVQPQLAFAPIDDISYVDGRYEGGQFKDLVNDLPNGQLIDCVSRALREQQIIHVSGLMEGESLVFDNPIRFKESQYSDNVVIKEMRVEEGELALNGFFVRDDGPVDDFILYDMGQKGVDTFYASVQEYMKQVQEKNQKANEERAYEIQIGTWPGMPPIYGEYHLQFIKDVSLVKYEEMQQIAADLGGEMRVTSGSEWADFASREDAEKFADTVLALHAERQEVVKTERLGLQQGGENMEEDDANVLNVETSLNAFERLFLKVAVKNENPPLGADKIKQELHDAMQVAMDAKALTIRERDLIVQYARIEGWDLQDLSDELNMDKDYLRAALLNPQSVNVSADEHKEEVNAQQFPNVNDLRGAMEEVFAEVQKNLGVDFPTANSIWGAAFHNWDDVSRVTNSFAETVLRESGNADEAWINQANTEYVSPKGEELGAEILESVKARVYSNAEKHKTGVTASEEMTSKMAPIYAIHSQNPDIPVRYGVHAYTWRSGDEDYDTAMYDFYKLYNDLHRKDNNYVYGYKIGFIFNDQKDALELHKAMVDYVKGIGREDVLARVEHSNKIAHIAVEGLDVNDAQFALDQQALAEGRYLEGVEQKVSEQFDLRDMSPIYEVHFTVGEQDKLGYAVHGAGMESEGIVHKRIDEFLSGNNNGAVLNEEHGIVFFNTEDAHKFHQELEEYVDENDLRVQFDAAVTNSKQNVLAELTEFGHLSLEEVKALQQRLGGVEQSRLDIEYHNAEQEVKRIEAEYHSKYGDNWTKDSLTEEEDALYMDALTRCGIAAHARVEAGELEKQYANLLKVAVDYHGVIGSQESQTILNDLISFSEEDTDVKELAEIMLENQREGDAMIHAIDEKSGGELTKFLISAAECADETLFYIDLQHPSIQPQLEIALEAANYSSGLEQQENAVIAKIEDYGAKYKPIKLDNPVEFVNEDGENMIISHVSLENTGLHGYKNFEDAYDNAAGVFPTESVSLDEIPSVARAFIMSQLTQELSNENNMVTDKNIDEFLENYKGMIITPRENGQVFSQSPAFGLATDCTRTDIVRVVSYAQLRQEAIDKQEKDTYQTKYHGKESYTVRSLTLPTTGEEVLVGGHSLNMALMPDGESYVDEPARFLDEKIFYYVEDSQLDMPSKELAALVEREALDMGVEQSENVEHEVSQAPSVESQVESIEAEPSQGVALEGERLELVRGAVAEYITKVNSDYYEVDFDAAPYISDINSLDDVKVQASKAANNLLTKAVEKKPDILERLLPVDMTQADEVERMADEALTKSQTVLRLSEGQAEQIKAAAAGLSEMVGEYNRLKRADDPNFMFTHPVQQYLINPMERTPYNTEFALMAVKEGDTQFVTSFLSPDKVMAKMASIENEMTKEYSELKKYSININLEDKTMNPNDEEKKKVEQEAQQVENQEQEESQVEEQQQDAGGEMKPEKKDRFANIDYSKYAMPEGATIEKANVFKLNQGQSAGRYAISAVINGKRQTKTMYYNDVNAYFDKNPEGVRRAELNQLVAKYFGKSTAESMGVSNPAEVKAAVVDQKEEEKAAQEKREEAAKAEQKRKAEEKKAQQEAKKKEEEAKKKEKKEPVAAAIVQATLLIGALTAAKANKGVFLNKDGKRSPDFVQHGQVVSPFNALMMALHSDANGYKTNDYATFQMARQGGYSVKGGESGLPFNWYNWDKYVNKFNANDIKTKEEYEALNPQEKDLYKVLRTKEERSIFNVDQTLMPIKAKEAYQGLLDAQDKAILGRGVKETIEAPVEGKTFHEAFKEENPDTMLIIRTGEDRYEIYGEDAKKAGEALGIKVEEVNGVAAVNIPEKDIEMALPALVRSGNRIAVSNKPEDPSVIRRYGAADKIYANVSQLAEGMRKQDENIDISSVRSTNYDASKGKLTINDSRASAPGKEVSTAIRRANDTFRVVVAYTGTADRLNFAGKGKQLPEDAARYNRLVQELAAGVLMTRQGLPATLSKESLKLVPYWERELKEDPKLVERLENDINNSLGVIGTLRKGEAVDYAALRGEKSFEAQRPKQFSIASEIATIPNIDTKAVVIIRDEKAKSAAVILPAGASLDVDNEVPGMNKNRFVIALKKEGLENVEFYNAGGSLGLNQPNDFFKDKSIEVCKLKQYELLKLESLDYSKEIADTNKVDIEQVTMIKDDENRNVLYVKPAEGESFTVYPEPADIKRFFAALKSQNFDEVRQGMGQKYYNITQKHPDLKANVLMPQVHEEVDLSRISKVSITKDKKKEGSFVMFATIDGERQKPVELSGVQAKRMWLVDDKDMYKLRLATVLFAEKLGIQEDQNEARFRDNNEGQGADSAGQSQEHKKEEEQQEVRRGRHR